MSSGWGLGARSSTASSGLAGAAVWMRSALAKVNEQLQAAATVAPPPRRPGPRRPGPQKAAAQGTNVLAPLDLSPYERAVAQITNPPLVVLSGDHNTFNPVTWKRDPNGNLIKVVKIGSDALIVTNIVPLYTIIAYDHPTGDGPIYVMSVQTGVDLRQPNTHKKLEYARKDEKKSNLYIVRGIKGAENNPSEINLEIPVTGQSNLWVSSNAPYKFVESYYADLKYPPASLNLSKKQVNDEFTLDNQPYKIVEITNDAVRVLSRRTTKVTEIKWSQSHNGT